MQILEPPELPVRNLDWYKARYDGLRDDIINQTHVIENLETENRSYKKYVENLQNQLNSAKDLIDTLWDTISDLTPNGMNRLNHDE